MTLSSLQRSLLPAAILAGVVFSTATLPLATLHSESVAIQLQDEPIFTGKLNELAAPYLGLATVISLGTGIATVAVMGWKQSSRKSSQVEDQVSELQKHLQEKEAQLEELTFSEPRLEASELHFFLQDETSVVTHPISPIAHVEPQYAVVETSAPTINTPLPETAQPAESSYQSAPVVTPTMPAATQPIAPKQVMASAKPLTPSGAVREAENRRTKVRAVTAFPAAQSFMGFTRLNQSEEPVPSIALQTADDSASTSAQINELLSHLKQVMSEIEKLRATSSAS